MHDPKRLTPSSGQYLRVATGATGTLQFTDSVGDLWTVREVDDCPAAWSRGERCLLFMSEHAVRRVWNVPPDWRALSAEALERLSWDT